MGDGIICGKEEGKGGGKYEEGLFQGYFKSSPEDLEARGERVLEDDRQEQAVKMGS